MRQLKILEYALLSLARRKGKTFAITVVFALTIAVLASVLLLTHALRSEAEKLLVGAPELVIQRVSAGRHELVPDRYAETIAALPGVGKVEPRVWGYYYDALTSSNYTMLGVNGASGALPLLQGRLPTASDECAVGRGVAETRRIELGDDLILIDQQSMGVSYQVVGVFDAASNLLTHDLILFQPAELRRFFALPDGYSTDISVTVFNPREIDNLAHKIKRDLPDTRPIARTEIMRTYDAVFNWRSGMLLSMFALALFAFCILAWDKATGLSAEEKMEIAVLKAVGWDTSDVLLLKFWEGIVVSLTALLVGLLLGFLHVFVWGAPLLGAVIKGWSVLYPDFDLTPYVDLQQIFVLAFLTVVPYLVATVVPSWRAAATDPDSVMRN